MPKNQKLTEQTKSTKKRKQTKPKQTKPKQTKQTNKKSNSCPKGFHLEKKPDGTNWCVKHTESHFSRKSNKRMIRDSLGHVVTISGPSYQNMSETIAYKI